MGHIDKTVFISYRRTNIPWVLAIFQNLTQHGYDVFFDYSGIASGDFERIILENIHARAHFLILLTPSALERCGDPTDWLRREIEAALDGRRNIVPLMLEGFDFGTPTIANQLTGKLAVLKHYNALSIPPTYFFEAMVRLRERFLNVALDAVKQPASFLARQAAIEQKSAAAKAPEVAEEELSAQQWFERGFNSADLNEKLRFYNQAIQLKPDFAEAFYNRGFVRRVTGDLEGALADNAQAIQLKPDFVEGEDLSTLAQIARVRGTRVTIEHNNPEKIWTTHMKNFDTAHHGITFYATCLVPKTEDGIHSVFNNDVFNAYCRKSYEYARSGKISMKKLFIVDFKRMLALSELAKHLREILTVCKELGPDKLQAKVLVVEEAKRKGTIGTTPLDFMIWGDEFLAISRMYESHILSGLELSSNSDEIKASIVHFEDLFGKAEVIEDSVPL
jgi:tetratricopeptide (TPR) repeat protein